jgi:outer membrane protein assembly factor BamB
MKKKYLKSSFTKKIMILLLLTLIIIPVISGFNITSKIEKIQKNYSFDKFYHEFNSETVDFNGLTEIDNPNVRAENIWAFDNSNKLSTNMFSGLMDSCWPMSCHDLHHTGRSPYSTIDNLGGEKWRFQTGGSMEAGIAIDNDGILYFGDLSSWTFYAVYPDGSLKWKYITGGLIWSAPAIAEDGTIYVGSWDAKLYAFKPDGMLKWYVGSGGSIGSSPAIGEDGTVYFGTLGYPSTGGCKIIALNPNGSKKWEYQTGFMIFSDPAIGDDGTIYIGSGDNYLYAMNPDGTLKWLFKTGDEIHSHPSIADDGTVYISSNDGYLYALNQDGSKKWEHYFGFGMYNSASIGNDGTIYVTNGALHALNPTDGSLKWSYDFYGSNDVGLSSPAIGNDGTIYVGLRYSSDKGGDIIAINSNGIECWRKKISNVRIESSPCIGSNGEVYIGSSCEDRWHNTYGYVHAFAPQENNHPPNTPIIGGKLKFGVNDEIFIIVECDDPENNPLSFYVDWGDGTNSGWKYGIPTDSLYYYFEHLYSSMGTYTIKVKARDDFGGESDWGASIRIISKNKAINTPLFLQKLIQHFPFFEKILNQNIFMYNI